MAEARVFLRLSPLSPRFARCHRPQKQSTGLFSSESLWLSPSLFESLFMKRKITTTKVVILSLAESKGFFRGCRLSRLALLVATVRKNSPPDCFLP
ncbi:hypothetical protein, partial [uncultured Eubacterium sp.]|uniref:hypothetical protein n=1 Tax=uncultured Eubacterium sp. TaxID=165185 RepID=UPI0026038D60